MKKYLVGGAVRDRLLGLSVTEKDWLVVGSSPKAMLDLEFTQVGKDFPVFLHPKTKEEYALARTERKAGQGYHGFICEFSPSVTLEEDLRRRDITINAMAEDEAGQVIDPYGGRADLEQGILRHVSEAFVEDPLRVLRVARFAARFHTLGFYIHEDTMQLMQRMVRHGELKQLTPERVWQEIHKSLQTPNPEIFFEVLRACGALKVLLPEIDALFGVPNPPQHHGEIDSGVHTLMVLKEASQLTTDPHVRFAALCHDLGKALTPIEDWPRHKGHEVRGVAPIEALSQRLHVPARYQQLALLACQYHLIVHRVFELKSATIVKYLERFDAFRRKEIFESLLLVSKADAFGCLGLEKLYPQATFFQGALEAAKNIDIKVATRLKDGDLIKKEIHSLRVKEVEAYLLNWKKYEK